MVVSDSAHCPFLSPDTVQLAVGEAWLYNFQALAMLVHLRVSLCPSCGGLSAASAGAGEAQGSEGHCDFTE